MKKILLCVMAALALASCSMYEHKDLKSPCVGAEGSPCDKRPVNGNWQG